MKNFAKTDQSHPSLNLYCFHISFSYGLHSKFKQDRRLWDIKLVFTCFCYLLPFLRYYGFSFVAILLLFRFIMGVYCRICVLRSRETGGTAVFLSNGLFPVAKVTIKKMIAANTQHRVVLLQLIPRCVDVWMSDGQQPQLASLRSSNWQTTAADTG